MDFAEENGFQLNVQTIMVGLELGVIEAFKGECQGVTNKVSFLLQPDAFGEKFE